MPRHTPASLLLVLALGASTLGALAPAAAAAEVVGPAYELTDALPGGTQPAAILASDGQTLLVHDGTRRVLLAGGSEIEVHAPPQLQLHDATAMVNDSLVVQQDSFRITWYDAAGHGGTWKPNPLPSVLAAAPGGWVYAENASTSTGTPVVRLRRVTALTGAVTTLRDLPTSAVPSPDEIKASVGLRDRVVLLTRVAGRTVITVVPFSGATQILKTADTSVGLLGDAWTFASAAGTAWWDGASVHARMANGAEIHRNVTGLTRAAVVAAGLVYSTGGAATLVTTNGTTTQGVTIGTHARGTALVGHLSGGLYTTTGTAAPTLLRADSPRQLSVSRVAVGADDVLWADNGEAGSWAPRAKARDAVAGGPSQGVRTIGATTSGAAAVTDVSGERALVQHGSAVQVVHRQADGTWTDEGAPRSSAGSTRLTGGWLTLSRTQVYNVIDGRTIDHLADGFTGALGVAGDTAWGVVVPTSGSGYVLRRTDLSSGQTRLITVAGGLALWRPAAWGDAVAVASNDTIDGRTTLLRYATNGTLLSSETGILGLPEALDAQLLVTRRLNGRELLVRNRATNAVTVIGDPYGIPAGSVSVYRGTVAWVGGDGVPRVQTVAATSAPAEYAGGAGPATVTSGSTWAATFPLTASLDSCAVEISSPLGHVRDLPCTPGAFQATASWDGRDGSSNLVPDGAYRWTLTGSGAGGAMPAAQGFVRVTGSAAPSHTLTVTISRTGPDANGSVLSSWPGIDCTQGTCSAPYPAGSVVTLSSQVGPGTSDGAWSGACTSAPCTVTLDQDRTVTKTLVDAAPAFSSVYGGSYLGSAASTYSDAGVTFSEGVTGITSSTLRLKDVTSGKTVAMNRLVCWGAGGDAPCGTGYATSVYFFPAARLVPGAPYVVVASAAVVDRAGSSLVKLTSAQLTAQRDAPYTAATAQWAGVADRLAAGGSYAHEQQHGATLTYRFTGSTVRWYFFRSPYGGRAKVTVDGVVKEAAAEQYASTRYRAYRTYSGLTATSHTITITVLGTHHAASKGTDINVDAFGNGSTRTCTGSGCVATPAYTGKLGLIDDGGWVGEGYRTHTRGSGATWRFYGTGFEAVAQGYVRISVDGGAFGPVTGSGWSVKRAGLARGMHTVRLIASAPAGYTEHLDLMWLTSVP